MESKSERIFFFLIKNKIYFYKLNIKLVVLKESQAI